jgi:hypothetical protein
LAAADPLVIIVNPQSPVQALTRREAADLFLGRRQRFPTGEIAIPIEQILPEDTRRQFYLRLTQLPLAAVRSHWARIFFSGQGQPPRQAADAEAMLELVATHQNTVGFLEQSRVTDRVRVVLVLE